jgi:hypothetical protein
MGRAGADRSTIELSYVNPNGESRKIARGGEVVLVLSKNKKPRRCSASYTFFSF